MTSPRSTTPGARHHRSALLTGLVLALVLGTSSGCGDDSSGPGEPAGGSASSPSTGPTESEATPEPSEPTETTPLGTGAAPASGPDVTLDSLTLNLPRGWETSTSEAQGFIASPRDPYQIDYLTVSTFANDGRTTGLDGAQREFATLSDFAETAKREGEVEVDGVPMVQLTGPAGSRELWAYASNSTPFTVVLEFEIGPRSEREARALVDSVLATIDFAE